MREFFHYALMRSTAWRALKVAGVITPVLTVFNHWDALYRLQVTPVFFFKVALTFTVPYLVSTYSSAMAAREQHRRDAGHAA